jgi:hypothetical protein
MYRGARALTDPEKVRSRSVHRLEAALRLYRDQYPLIGSYEFCKLCWSGCESGTSEG